MSVGRRNSLFGQAVAVWLGLLVFAVINGYFRVNFLEPQVGSEIAHFLSTTTLCGAVFLATLLFIGNQRLTPAPRDLFGIGLLWSTSTVLVETILGLTAGRRSATDLFADYDLLRGRLFVFVLLAEVTAPPLVGWFRAGAARAEGVSAVGQVAMFQTRPFHEEVRVISNRTAQSRSRRLVENYLPAFDVSDYRETRVRADPDRAYAALRSLDINRSRIVRTLFAIRALPARLRGDTPAPVPPAKSLLDQTLEIGWRILEERSGREIVVGAVTRPWEAVVRFRGLAPQEFIEFEEPGFTKIAWSNRVRPAEPGFSIVSLETRVLATDPVSRRRFGRYWLAVGLGIRLIRIEALRLVKRDLERGRRDPETKKALTSRAST